MRTIQLRLTIVVLAVVAILSATAPLRAAQPDWKTVEQALGKAGQLRVRGQSL